MGLDALNDGLAILTEHPVAAAAGAAVIGAGVGVAVGSAIGSGSKKKTFKRRTHTRRGWKLDRKKFNKSQKWEVSYRRRKAKKYHKRTRSSKKIHYAKKTGQPYIIKANGQAKFIKGKRRK